MTTPSAPEQADRPALPRQLFEQAAVVVLRATRAEYLDAAVDALLACGLSGLEVTFTVPDAPAVIRRLRDRLAPHACIGAGTVTTAEQARAALEAGAQFLVSPTFDAPVLRESRAAGVPYLPGAMTPTEIATAWTAGAAAVKIFPAATLGPRYIASVREPLPAPLLLPSGGVRIDDLAEYLRVGAVAVGLGGDLLGDALHGGSLPGLRERARRVGEQVRQHRNMAGLK